MSTLTAFPMIGERSEATPGLWNQPFSIISANIRAVSEGPFSISSGATISLSTNINVSGGGHFQFLSVGSTPPSYITTAAITIAVNSNQSDYLYFTDSAAAKSNYVIGSRAGGTADGLNIWDASGSTMIVSFSKQSIRFYQNVVGPVFDTGGALASTYNAATFIGSGSTLSAIQAAINQASIDGVLRVYLPASMYPYASSSISFINSVQMVREGGNWSYYDVWAYGAPHGGTDDPAAIQAAANAAATKKGTVFFPPSTYNIGTSITMNAVSDLHFQGAGGNGSLLAMAASGVTIFRFTGVCSRVGIRDLWLGSFVSRALGGSLEIVGTNGVHSDTFLVENVTCQNTPNPVFLQYLDGSNFNNLRIRSSITSAVVGYGLYAQNLISTNFHEFIADLTAYGSALSFPKDVVAIDDNCDTVIFMDSQALGGIGYGVHCLPKAASTGNRLGRFTNMLVESCTSGGFLIEGARDVHMASCHAAVNGGPGYKVTGGDGVQIYDSLSYQNNEDGIIITGGRAVEVCGCVCTNNGQTANNTYDGINIASGTSGIRILNNRSGDVFLSLANKQRSGISIAASTDYLTVANNDLVGNSTSGLASLSTGVNNFMLDSSNVTTSSGGTFTALTGMIVRNTLLVGTDPGNDGSLLRVGGPIRNNSYVYTGGANGAIRFDNRTSSNSSVMAIFNQSGTDFNFANASNGNLYMRLGGTVFSSISLTPETSGAADLGSTNRPWGRMVVGTGTALAPSSTVSSEQSLGWYRSGASTMAVSYGTVDLTASGAVTSIASLTIKSGANNTCGSAVLGSNGSVNVANTYVKTGDLIFLTDISPGGTIGSLEMLGIRNSSGFTIASTNVADTSTVAWLIVRPG